MSPFVHNY